MSDVTPIRHRKTCSVKKRKAWKNRRRYCNRKNDVVHFFMLFVSFVDDALHGSVRNIRYRYLRNSGSSRARVASGIAAGGVTNACASA